MPDPFATSIAEWQQQSTCMAQAMADRDYDRFTVAFRAGCRCFRLLQKSLIGPDRAELLARYRQELQTAATSWLVLCDDLKAWKDEIAREAQKVHREQRLDRKIAGTYGYLRKTGNALRLSR